MLGWSARDLAFRAHVGLSTVLRIERSGGEARGSAKSLERIEVAFRSNGIAFVQDTGTVGVTLKN